MSGAGHSIAIKTPLLARPFDLRTIPPALVQRPAAPRRTKIWEFNTNLHCSVIGTCLSAPDLKQILKKAGLPVQGRTDHELHGMAVTVAGRHDDTARQLNKALDHRHKLAISRFARAGDAAGVQLLWQESVRRGDIPGAYWATLTHPHTNQTIVRDAFGDVHMLSHLIGSSNRADIRRLCQLETDKADLESRLERQQHALHRAVADRDTQIQALRQTLADKIVSDASAVLPTDNTPLFGLVADREKRLAAESRRGTTLDSRLKAMQADRDAERAARTTAEAACDAMRHELRAAEEALGVAPSDTPPMRLDGLTLLYVGGRPNQVAPMRAATQGLGAAFLHHDGGMEHRPSLLAGLMSQSDIALFPVDCISHEAANAVKSLSRQAGKRFIPLRSASVTALLVALRSPAIAG